MTEKQKNLFIRALQYGYAAGEREIASCLRIYIEHILAGTANVKARKELLETFRKFLMNSSISDEYVSTVTVRKILES